MGPFHYCNYVFVKDWFVNNFSIEDDLVLGDVEC